MPIPVPRLPQIAALATDVCPWANHIEVERVAEGVSTYVFRLACDHTLFYVRVLPDEGDTFAPEVYVHTALRARGVGAPEVIYYEALHKELQGSVMVVTAIHGQALGYGPHPWDERAVLVAAGRDLAILSGIEVDGFGWISRDEHDPHALQGDLATHRAFVFEYLEADLATLVGLGALRPQDATAIGRIAELVASAWPDRRGRLAHGDFDASHIFHDHGHYSGLIDFGEIRGADPVYDLGHFNIQNSERLPFLLEGYRQAAELPMDFEERIWWWTLLIAVRRVGRGLMKSPPRPPFAFDMRAIHQALRLLGA